MDANDQDSNTKKPMSPVISGVAGAVIGAGMAVAATKILSDRKTRDRITHTISGVRRKIAASVDKAREELKGKKRELKHKAEESEEALKQATP